MPITPEHVPKEYRICYDHVEVVGDGDKLCARFHDFDCLQTSPAGFGNTDAGAIADLAWGLHESGKNVSDRLKAIMPLFQEARDALSAITTVQAKLHNIRLDLADRMDDVGIPERWRARAVLETFTERTVPVGLKCVHCKACGMILFEDDLCKGCNAKLDECLEAARKKFYADHAGT